MKYIKILSPLFLLFPGILIALLYSSEIEFPIYGSDEFLFFTFTIAFSLFFIVFYVLVIAYPGIVFSIIFVMATIQITRTTASARQKYRKLKQKIFRDGRESFIDTVSENADYRRNFNHQHLKKTALRFFFRNIFDSRLQLFVFCAPAVVIEFLFFVIFLLLKKFVLILIIGSFVFVVSFLFYSFNFPVAGKNLITTLGVPFLLLLFIPAFDRLFLNGTFVFLGFRQTKAHVIFSTKTLSDLKKDIPKLSNPSRCAVFYFTGSGEAVLNCQVSSLSGKTNRNYEIYVPANKIRIIR